MNEQSIITRLHTWEYGTLDYDPSVPCIIATHLGFSTDEEFKDMLNQGLQYAIVKRKEHCKMAWLADTSLMSGNAMAEWAAADWNPRALAGGIYHIAFVSPKDIFADMQIRDFLKLGSRKLESASFADVDSAKEWLHDAMANLDVNS